MSDEYTKINTIFKREMKNGNPGRIIEGDFSKEEFKNIKLWHITEKIHGMNMRIIYDIFTPSANTSDWVYFRGKTDDAMIPGNLVDYLRKIFPVKKFEEIWPMKDSQYTVKKVILYGEGYGPKVQEGGGRYRDDASFILFDVKIDNWWLEPNNVKDIAQKFGIDYVPELGIMTMEEAIAIVKEQKPISRISKDRTYIAEGIVARSYPLVLFRNGEPVIWKLKVKDYK